MEVLIQTNGAVATLTDLKEQQVEPAPDRFLFWEAFRTLVNTIGARDALDQVLRQQNANQHHHD